MNSLLPTVVIRTTGAALVATAALVFVAPAFAGDGIIVGHYSQQAGRGHAVVRATIASTGTRKQRSAVSSTAPHSATDSSRPQRTQETINVALMYPPLPKNAPILQRPHPAGPGSFWYSVGAGRTCIYAPASVTPCFTVTVQPGNTGGALTPSTLAASIARRLDLVPGALETSPAHGGLTGSASWYWLDPAPQRQSLSISLAGETVSVTADPTVQWRFGDGASLDGGPGVPYQADARPADAIQHVYETRCLPGDQGHDPYVLASCGDGGYTVDALVVWHITYSASGPLGGGGTLPTRTTETSSAYPVSESRAFLTNGGGQ